MRAYVYLLGARKGYWPKAHWFFDDDPDVRGGVVAAPCGLMANKASMGSPTSTYFLSTTRNGKTLPISAKWCTKCRRWMHRHQEELLVHERILEAR
jgi:hypothetical protein